jgi:hypothetical protein
MRRSIENTKALGVDLGNLKFEAINFETCKITWKTSLEYGDSADLPMPFRDLKMVSQVSVNLSSIDAARTKIYLIEPMKQAFADATAICRSRPPRPKRSRLESPP